MDKVKKLMEAGASLADAVRITLGLTFTDLCRKYEIDGPQWSHMLNLRWVPSTEQLRAIKEELGVDADEWLSFWFQLAQKAAMATQEVA